LKLNLYLVVNLHGKIDSSVPVRKALEELKVERKFTATVVPDDPSTTGMLNLCKDYVAWSQVDAELLATLLERRGMVSESRRLDDKALSNLGFKKHRDLAEKMVKEGTRLSSVEGVRPFFRLSPPRGGFKASLRRQYSERGTLGKNPGLPDIVRRMV
jgi:large subunit ribosomal protein L30